MITLRNVEKFYEAGYGRSYVLRRINLDVNPTFALGHIFRQKVFCFQWAGRQGLHYILS
jgi:hypothetical protein